jgi:2-dehydropantoate 2-reductase
MRYLVVGAGAVGGAIGARLAEAGHDVVLVARGRHLEVLRERGLTFVTQDGTSTLRLPAVGGPAEVTPSAEDVLVLATKTQDSAAALAAWAAAGVAAPVLCAQNGVENERLALRYFDRVYAACVWLPATFTEPGVVLAPAAPNTGVLQIGRYPDGRDDTADAIAADLTGARIATTVRVDAMRWKYGKLVRNLGNAFDALFSDVDGWAPLRDRTDAEARAVLAAAGIATTDADEEGAARAGRLTVQDLPGQPRGGSSTWQSLVRGAGSTEVDYLNGEIVLLGRTLNVPTPVNRAVQVLAGRAAAERLPPRSLPVADLLALLPDG